ncbi:MAG: DUF445 family protein [Acidobacteria bacterium]|nr:DUF445 family protein [Acidobacteriota bacterium]
MISIELLIKLSPIVVATLHGYAAAWLAVKMLFRPRNPVYIFGMKVPLTPGMLPKERDQFIIALSTVIGEKLLDVETITDEIMQLNLEPEITSIAKREYLHHSQSESTIQLIVEHIKEKLYHLRDSAEARSDIARSLRRIVETEIDRRFSLLRRFVTDFFLDEAALNRIVGDSITQLADQIAESLYLRSSITQAMAQIPETIFDSESTKKIPAINNFVSILSHRLDVRGILIKRLNALSNEAIEELIMETAGREIAAIVWFGAGIGFIVGIIQTLINFI